MFWNIFLNSLVLIVAILFIGWGIARFVEMRADKSSPDSSSSNGGIDNG